ncbi:hypothetical protein CTAYLR_001758 [Chrysophaeum taylorii]|uniref:Complex I-ESSS n=1 Tax=Chrysophaeum taylorii TaxID=2483200 RepID=A0AAD7UEQ6_9STRA|nr:hypothetical protein CTAYLR_001758 [Chrysophaeum taylorii]
MLLRLASQSVRRGAPVRVPARRLGAGPQPKHGTLFGETAETKWEGWEPIVYTAYAASAIVLIVGLANKPQTSILQWAREEALARMKILEAGGDVQYGVHYSNSKITFSKEDVGELPVQEEEED